VLKGLKSYIALILITASGGTHAVHINYDRTGQIALLPYYTVNNSFITNFTVTNTSWIYKVVRVRLLDSHIGADLLNINLYLSPDDVWNATLRMNPQTGLPNLITEDESCTYPAKEILQAGVDIQNSHTATTDADLTEGYIEIIEMGDIADGAGLALDGGFVAEIDVTGIADGVINTAAGDRSIPMGLLHDAAGLPADCSVVADAWAAGAASESAINGFEPGSMSADGIAQDGGDPVLPYDNSHNAGLVAPSGGINAYGILINTATGAAFVEEGVHIGRYTTVPQHYLPDDPVHYRLPSLASGDVREAYITNALGDGKKGDRMPLTEYDTGALQDISPLPSVPMGSNPLPIAMVLSADNVSAPYFIDENVSGETDIILTFPMRKHGIFNGGLLSNQFDSNETACIGELNDGINDGREVTLASLGAVVQDYPHDEAGNHCTNAGFELRQSDYRDVYTGILYYDYEEDVAVLGSGDPGLAPLNPYPSPHELFLDRSVNVSTFRRANGSTSGLFGSPNESEPALTLEEGINAGWTTFILYMDSRHMDYSYERISFISVLTEPVGGLGAGVNNSWTGVPVIGFAAMAADVGPAQLGETIELIRSVNRD
jgi:hypothetical protein